MTTPSESPSFFYFDLGNVLVTFDHEIACRQIGELTGLSPDRVRAILFDEGLEEAYERGQIDSREFYEQFCELSGTRPDYQALHYAGSAIFQLNVPMVPLVTHLKSAGYRLGILSNTCDEHWAYVSKGRYTVIPLYFEVCVLSYQVQAMKPAPSIYQAAARAAGVAPGEIFFVDDRIENVKGGVAAGFDAVHFTSVQDLTRALRERGVHFNL